MEAMIGYLNGNWLNEGTATASMITTGVTSTASYYDPTMWPYPTTYPVYVTTATPARPIRLTMSEVERLRKAARADDKLRDVLAKFTDQIEVVVDFGEAKQ